MLRDRSAPVDLFALVPALQLRFEPELAQLDRLLEDDQIFQRIKADPLRASGARLVCETRVARRAAQQGSAVRHTSRGYVRE